MSSALDLAELLADRAGTVVLTQAATPTEARLIAERIAAAGGTDRPPVSLGPPGDASSASGTSRTSGASGGVAGASGSPGGGGARIPGWVLSGEDTRLVPVRVAWLPEERGGRRAARLHDVLPGQDPYHPSERQQRRILARRPGRAAVLVGEPATVGSLRQRWAETTGGDDFPGYVARRATLALDRAEYRLRGPRYKTPSLVRDEILSSRRFRAGLRAVRGAEVAEASEVSVAPGGSGTPTLEEAGEILDELAAGWSRRLIDILPTVGRLIFQRGFDPQIDYDPAQVERLRTAMERYPGILLWSHRSNLDTLVLAAALQEQHIPPAHLFAGINMAFGPMGAIMRRAGVIFIRRSTADDPLYKYVLREYVGYVLEKRFNLSWSIEGTRSRTGKMLPPRLGLLSYAADAYLQGRVDDIALLPVSITFDQLHEISEYAAYAQGAAKKPEGFGWLYNFIKAQGARHYGKVYVRFGEPVLLSSFLGPVAGHAATGGAADGDAADGDAADGDAAVSDAAVRRLALQKTAFEVAWRINQGMPVTATAIVTTVLLAMQGAALTFGQIRLGLGDALSYLESRSVPRTALARALSGASALRATLDALVSGGVVTLVRDGREPVWLIGPEHQLAATFYRNSLINFLLDTALCELAVLRAGEAAASAASAAPAVPAVSASAGALGGSLAEPSDGSLAEPSDGSLAEPSDGSLAGPSGGWPDGSPAGGDADPVAAFWDEIGRLRDLLKFEFYFKDREEHRRQVGEEMSRHNPAWEDRLRAGEADALLAEMRPLVSHIMVRPFVEAYRIVADVLVHDDVASGGDAEVTSRALGLGQQYVAQRRLRSSESVSVLLFQTGLQLARNRGLFEPGAGGAGGAGGSGGAGGADLAGRRADFLAELRHLVRRLDRIENLAIRRYIRDAVSVMPTD